MDRTGVWEAKSNAMKIHPFVPHPRPSLFLLTTLAGVVSMGWNNNTVHAETQVTQTTVTTTEGVTSMATPAEIASQELELKEKLLEFEKAKLVVQKSETLDIRKAQLEIEIKKLELLKARRDLMVQETKEQLAMLVEGNVLFDVNSAVVKAGALPTLREVALILAEYPKGQVVVAGFADSTGNMQANLELSRKRAESVKTCLLDNSSGMISSERVTAQGMGDSKPVATNTSSAGRQLNRRVEITVTKSLGN
jgi:outer membrane protein OmpA-like peptidoglycan-associated protein